MTRAAWESPPDSAFSGPDLKRPGLQPRHVEEIADEPVEPFRLLLNGAQEARLNGFIELASMAYQTCCRAENRGKRRAQIMRNRGKQRRAQAIGLRGETCAVGFGRQVHAIDRKSGLVRQGVKE